MVGQPLGYPFIREKKFDGKRLYYLVYLEWHAALLVTFSDKKTQAQTISFIKQNLPSYREFVHNWLKQNGFI